MARERHRLNVSRLSRVASTALAAGSLGACSLSFPLPAFNEGDATGSIRSRPVLARDLDREDLRRAQAALAVALDPQGNGEDVAWRNPQSGAKGSFVALAPPFVEHDRVCRAFKAHVAAAKGDERKLNGSACRDADGGWKLAELEDDDLSPKAGKRQQ